MMEQDERQKFLQVNNNKCWVVGELNYSYRVYESKPASFNAVSRLQPIQKKIEDDPQNVTHYHTLIDD